ncbi:MAG: DUF664 domain-containing protein [Phycicoccus sp.]
MPAPETDVEMHLRYLRAQRQHLLSALEGLDEERMWRSVMPSGWSLASLVHHVTVDVEMWWFGAIVAGDQEVLAEVEASDGWNPPDVPAAEIVDRYVVAGRRSDEIVLAAGLDADLAWWPDDTPRHRRNVGDVLLHVIAETAAHAGHADAAVELIDGRQWLVLTSGPVAGR